MDYTRTILCFDRGLRAEHFKPNVIRHQQSLVFVHGICHGSWVWWNFMDYFASQGFSCYGLNLRGHFLSSGHAELGMATTIDYVADVATCCAAIPGPVILVGHSMGGIVCQKAAEQSRVHKLILLDSAPCRHVTEHYLSIDPRRMKTSRKAFQMLPDGTVCMDRNPDIVRELFFEKNKVSDEALMQTVSLLGRESAKSAADHGFLDVDPSLLSCPVYVLGRTGLGNSANPDMYGALADYLKAKERCLRDDISHNMMCEQDWQDHAALVERWCLA